MSLAVNESSKISNNFVGFAKTFALQRGKTCQDNIILFFGFALIKKHSFYMVMQLRNGLYQYHVKVTPTPIVVQTGCSDWLGIAPDTFFGSRKRIPERNDAVPFWSPAQEVRVLARLGGTFAFGTFALLTLDRLQIDLRTTLPLKSFWRSRFRL